MGHIRVSLSFHRTKVDEIDTFAIGVRDGIYNNAAVFTTPPIVLVDFQTAIDTYINTRGAYKNGGTAQKGPFEAAKTAIMDVLDETAEYVDEVANGDPNIIYLSGFKPTKGTASAVPEPTQFQDIKLSRGATGELIAECENQKYVDTYICIMSIGEPIPDDIGIDAAGQLFLGSNDAPIPTPPEGEEGAEPAPLETPQGAIVDFNKPRRKKFIGLTPGVTYYFSFFGINASGVGPLSVAKSIVCW